MNKIYSKIKITREGTFNIMDTIEKNRKNIKRKNTETSKIFEFLLQPVEDQSHIIDFYKKGDEKSSLMRYINCAKTKGELNPIWII